MSLSDDQNLECPLCMEPFEMDDFTFFPCTCGYQICRFCWHRIRTDENGLCPACRKQYPEDPADFKPLSVEEFQKIKSEKRQKDQQRKHKASESRKHLSDVRVVQKNLVFVVGLPARLAETELLKKHDYFGKFGRIHKVVVNQSTSYAGSQGPSASAYVTYYKPEDALRAIKTVNFMKVDGRTLKASLGTTKYCSHFLKNQQCPKSDCMYLHELGDEAASFTKEDMRQGKHQEYERKLQEQHQICITKKEAVSPTLQKKPHSCKETWPSAPQNSKVVRAKESKTDKQNRSKSKHTSSDSQKSKKIKGKSDDLSHSNSSSIKNVKSREDSSATKRNSKPHKFSKDNASSNPSLLQRTEEPSVFRTIISSDKQSVVTEMNNRNVQKTLVHIEEQKSLCSQNMKSTNKARGDSLSYPSSPTSSSSSSLFTPYGSLSSNFMSSSPSPPPHRGEGDHILFCAAEKSSQNLQSGNYSTRSSPQNIIGPAFSERPQSITFGSVESNGLSCQLDELSLSPGCGPMSEDVTQEDELEANPSFDYSFPSQMQQQDDDLDFDPWDESSKGLADLIAKEETVITSYTSTSIPPGFSHLVHSSVPNQRITPPPGFICKQHTANIGYAASSTFITPKEKIHPLMNEPSCRFQGLPPNKAFYYPKPFAVHRMTELLSTKHLQDDFRALLPNVNVTFSGCGPQNNYSQSGLPTTHPCGDGAWLPHEIQTAPMLPGNGSGLYPVSSSSQCPPPGFVAPSRSPGNTPFQHVQVNQSEWKSRDASIG